MTKRYKVLERSYINGALVERGDVVSLPEDVHPGKNLEAITASEVKDIREAADEVQKPWPEQEQDRTPAFGQHPLQEAAPKIIDAAVVAESKKK